MYLPNTSSRANSKTDALSRLQFNRFWKLAQGKMNSTETPVTACLLPMRDLWLENTPT